MGVEAHGWLTGQEGEERKGRVSQEIGGEAEGRGGPEAWVVREGEGAAQGAREGAAHGEGRPQAARGALGDEGRRGHRQAQQGGGRHTCRGQQTLELDPYTVTTDTDLT